ncbi:MAG TPA: type II CAAX endopeptidase family protein [Polyangiaceae bacterium]|nr:type II CAAX endopeptidase family protein [Polyangiaceae bacterium]
MQRARPDLTHFGVVAWVLGVTFVLGAVGQPLLFLASGAVNDLVVLVGAEAVVYLAGCALFSLRRPGRSFEDLFALRRVPVGLVVVAFLVGVFAHAPADKLGDLILKFFPSKESSDALAAQLVPHGPVHAVLLALFIAGVGPFVEELFFRGALYTGLRTTAGAASSVVTTGLMFTLIHFQPREWLPIFLLATCLGIVRASSGSLWPGVALHAAFNGSSLALAWLGPSVEARWLSPSVVAASSAGALVLLALSVRLAQKSELAERARALDEAEPSSGATP